MKKWFALVLVTSIAGVCLAQSTLASKKELKKAPMAKFSMVMLENNHIQPVYAGMPVAELVGAIEKLSNLKKGEFESSADFNARNAAAHTGKFLGDSSLDDTFAFVFKVSSASERAVGFQYKFNADTSEVQLFALPESQLLNGIGAPADQTSRRQSSAFDLFNLDSKIDEKRTYQASNAYGATVAVEKTRSTVLGIAADRIPSLSFTRAAYYFNPIPAAKFNLDNAKAAKELPAMKALVVMKLAAPYIMYSYFYEEPTRGKPVEISMQSKYLTGNVSGIVFYSGLTGEVFARLPENFGKPVPKVESQ